MELHEAIYSYISEYGVKGEDMELKEFMKKNRWTPTMIGREIDYSPNYLCLILNGKRRCGRKAALAISRFTNNEVTVQEIFDIYKEDKKEQDEENKENVK